LGKKEVIATIIGIIIIIIVSNIDRCNKPGTIADKINWSGNKTCKETK